MASEPREPVEEKIARESDDEWHPVTENPACIIQHARNRDLVVECTGASGVTHSFTHAFEDLWAARCVLRSGDSRTWVVHQQREDTIENCIRRCYPDVRLIEESISTFGGDEDDEGP